MARFNLRTNMSSTVEGVRRNFSMYTYDSNDVVSRVIKQHGGFESHLVKSVIKQLYAFAKVGPCPASMAWHGCQRGALGGQLACTHIIYACMAE